MRWFWLSFVDNDLPETEQFLGVCIVGVNERSINFIDIIDPTDRIELLRERGQEADVPFYTAVETARVLGINPGGEVQGYEITDDIWRIKPEFRNRLLSAEELVEHKLGKQQ